MEDKRKEKREKAFFSKPDSFAKVKLLRENFLVHLRKKRKQAKFMEKRGVIKQTENQDDEDSESIIGTNIRQWLKHLGYEDFIPPEELSKLYYELAFDINEENRYQAQAWLQLLSLYITDKDGADKDYIEELFAKVSHDPNKPKFEDEEAKYAVRCYIENAHTEEYIVSLILSATLKVDCEFIFHDIETSGTLQMLIDILMKNKNSSLNWDILYILKNISVDCGHMLVNYSIMQNLARLLRLLLDSGMDEKELNQLLSIILMIILNILDHIDYENDFIINDFIDIFREMFEVYIINFENLNLLLQNLAKITHINDYFIDSFFTYQIGVNEDGSAQWELRKGFLLKLLKWLEYEEHKSEGEPELYQDETPSIETQLKQQSTYIIWNLIATDENMYSEFLFENNLASIIANSLKICDDSQQLSSLLLIISNGLLWGEICANKIIQQPTICDDAIRILKSDKYDSVILYIIKVISNLVCLMRKNTIDYLVENKIFSILISKMSNRDWVNQPYLLYMLLLIIEIFETYQNTPKYDDIVEEFNQLGGTEVLEKVQENCTNEEINQQLWNLLDYYLKNDDRLELASPNDKFHK